MDRRTFLKNMSVASASCLIAPGMMSCNSAHKQPNILFLFADDQCHEALSAFGSEVQTPNLDMLVKNGVTFSNAYNMGAWHGAVCVASRTMINTGRFLWHAHNLEENLLEEADAGHMWPQYLERAGYETWFSGKWHVKIDPAKIFNHTKNVRPGMPNQTEAGYNRPIEGQPDRWSPSDTSFGGFWKGGKHWSEVLADDGIEYLVRARNSDKPFFMYLAFNAPHDPRQSPQEYVDNYPLEDVKIPANFIPEYPYKEEMGSGKNLRDEKLAPFPRTEYAVKVNRQEYYAIINHMDDQIGKILDALKNSGKMDNTYIFFTADHGLAAGHHGLMGKQNMFEHSVRPPLVVNGPGVPKNTKIEAPVYLQDVMPSTLELAGAKIPEHIQFRSLLPLISGKRSQNYNAIYGGYMNRQRMVRKGDYKLICYPEINKWLLFNLKEDSDEMNNIYDDAENESIVANLKQELLKLQRQTGDELEII